MAKCRMDLYHKGNQEVFEMAEKNVIEEKGYGFDYSSFQEPDDTAIECETDKEYDNVLESVWDQATDEREDWTGSLAMAYFCICEKEGVEAAESWIVNWCKINGEEISA